MKAKANTKRLLCAILAALMALTLAPCGALAWSNDDLTSTTWPYLVGWTGGGDGSYGKVRSVLSEDGTLYSANLSYGPGTMDIMPILNAPEGASSVFTPAEFYFSQAGSPTKPSTITPMEAMPADHSTPVKYFVRAADGRGYPMFIMTQSDRGGRKNTAEEDAAIIDYVTKPLLNMLRQYHAKMEDLYQARQTKTLKVGDYHPVLSNLLYYIGRYPLAFQFGSLIDLNTSVNLFTDFDCNGENAEAELRALLEKFSAMSGSSIHYYSLDYYKATLEVVAPFYLDFVEQTRIQDPVIESFSIGDSKGVIDRANRTVTIRFPEGTDLSALPQPQITTASGLLVSRTAGSLENGKLLYTVTPWEESTGVKYNGVLDPDEYGFSMGVDLSALWTIIVETGEPYNRVDSFSITTADGTTRYAKIDEDNKSISLNLPKGTDLSSLTPNIVHTGTHTNMDGGNINFTTPQQLIVYNSGYGLETAYTVTVTAEESGENRILAYSIDGAEGTIDDAAGTIAITIPYATDLPTADVKIEISEFAQLTESPAAIAEGENKYTVRAENGSERTYTVTVTRTPAARGNSILSFSYGSVKGDIDEINGSITLTLPAGTSTKFAPSITLSEFATVSPASGVVQDFSSPVKYKVTAQNGATNTYTVTVKVSSTPTENEYKARLQGVVDKIITRYHTNAADDWEWMNLGFYSNVAENTADGFSIASIIGSLDTTTNVAMTNIDRKMMTLTARGFDCSNLAQYNGGQPFTDSKGNAVDDLVSVLYNYGGSYTINGPAFALMALDMGNYTIPENAKWTRAALLETLLNHVYLSDGFDTDMVAAIMYAIAPYQDDPEFGGRVTAKLNEGLGIIINKMTASDYSFKAWGAVNSETASWVIMALCSMGIDCHTDPRFSDGQGKSALQHWVDTFANEQSGYFHHTTGVMNNAMATYEGCYASLWYLGFLERGGQGHPYYFYSNRFDFSRKLSSDASITAFSIEGQQGEITEGAENTITVTVPEGMPLENITPDITIAEGAKLMAPTLPVTFVAGVKQPFSVMAEDGATIKTYYVTVNYGDVQASGAEIDISSIKLQNSVLSEEAILSKTVTEADDGATEITLGVKPGVMTDKMFIAASISYGATVDPLLDGKTMRDLSDWMTFTVTAGDGVTKKVYRIKVEAKAQAEITSFRVNVNGTWYDGVIDNVYDTITVTDVDDSALTTTRLETDITFTGKTCQPTSGAAVDFGTAVTYTLSGDNTLAGRTYTVTVTNKSGQAIRAGGGNVTPTPSVTTAEITSFRVLGVDGVIDQTLGTIVVTLPNGTNVTAVAPEVTVPYGCVVSPCSGEVVNLTLPVVYTVTLGTEAKQYTVSIAYERSISQQLWDEVAKDGNNTVSDHQVSRDPHPLPGGSSSSGGWAPLS